jgi:heat shock protein HslJ
VGHRSNRRRGSRRPASPARPRLVEFQGSDETTLKPDNPGNYTITFQPGGRLDARIDCNRGRGTWRSSGPQLVFGPLALTRATCPPGSLYGQIVKQWPYVRSYVIRNGHLFLSLMADGGIYEFEPVAGTSRMAGAAERLDSTYWRLVYLADAPVAGAPHVEPHLIFNAATGGVSGSGGCNRLTGTYEVRDDRLTLSRMAGSLMDCAEGMETEQAFLDALERVSRWRITDQELELQDEAGAEVARFEGRRL